MTANNLLMTETYGKGGLRLTTKEPMRMASALLSTDLPYANLAKKGVYFVLANGVFAIT